MFPIILKYVNNLARIAGQRFASSLNLVTTIFCMSILVISCSIWLVSVQLGDGRLGIGLT